MSRPDLAAWKEATLAASVGFAGLLGVGAVLLVGLKLQNPNLAAGSTPFAVLGGIVVLSMATLGVPISWGRVETIFFPLGALLVAGAAIASGARQAARRRKASVRDDVIRGALIGIPFGVVSFAAAAVATVRMEPGFIAPHAIAALVLGLLWGSLFGVAGAVSRRGWREPIREVLDRMREANPARYGAVTATMWTLAIAILLTGIALMVWLFVVLSRGLPPSFGAADLVAAIVYFVALLPNLIVWVLGMSFGAPLRLGAGITVDGDVVGRAGVVSIFDPPSGAPLQALVLIPLLSGCYGAARARRTSRLDPTANGGGSIALMTGALFGAILFVLALVDRGQLGPGLLHRPYAYVALDPWLTGLLAFAWVTTSAFLGWTITAPRGGSTP